VLIGVDLLSFKQYFALFFLKKVTNKVVLSINSEKQFIKIEQNFRNLTKTLEIFDCAIITVVKK